MDPKISNNNERVRVQATLNNGKTVSFRMVVTPDASEEQIIKWANSVAGNSYLSGIRSMTFEHVKEEEKTS